MSLSTDQTVSRLFKAFSCHHIGDKQQTFLVVVVNRFDPKAMFWKMTTISRQNRKYVEAADAGTEIEVVEQPAWHAISHASLSAESVDLADPDLPVSQQNSGFDQAVA